MPNNHKDRVILPKIVSDSAFFIIDGRAFHLLDATKYLRDYVGFSSTEAVDYVRALWKERLN
jgi:hypothetical protein